MRIGFRYECIVILNSEIYERSVCVLVDIILDKLYFESGDQRWIVYKDQWPEAGIAGREYLLTIKYILCN